MTGNPSPVGGSDDKTSHTSETNRAAASLEAHNETVRP